MTNSPTDMAHQRQAIVRGCFAAWLTQDSSAIERHFADDVRYVESHGPVYTGKQQVLRWFADWHRQGRVLKWEICHFFAAGNTCIVEWYFECEFAGKTTGFDGVSLIGFDIDNRVVLVKEYQSKHEHHYPYGR